MRGGRRLQSKTIVFYREHKSFAIRAGQLAREKYGVRTLIAYLPEPAYMRRSGSTDTAVMQRLREGGLDVIDAGLDPAAFPGETLKIPGDGHPTGIATRAWAAMIAEEFERLDAAAR